MPFCFPPLIEKFTDILLTTLDLFDLLDLESGTLLTTFFTAAYTVAFAETGVETVREISDEVVAPWTVRALPNSSTA